MQMLAKGRRPELRSGLLSTQKLVQHFAQHDPTGSIFGGKETVKKKRKERVADVNDLLTKPWCVSCVIGV